MLHCHLRMTFMAEEKCNLKEKENMKMKSWIVSELSGPLQFIKAMGFTECFNVGSEPYRVFLQKISVSASLFPQGSTPWMS